MRLRITRQLCESIDGIQFSAFRPGYVYKVGTTVANYLLASGAAEAVDDDEPYLILPPEKHLFYPTPARKTTARRQPEQPRDVRTAAIAADRPLRRHQVQQDAATGVQLGPRVASRLRARVAELAKKVDAIKDELERLRRAS
jgi:hypothetical protein